MDLGSFRWLLTGDGQTLLAVAERAYEEAAGDPVRAATTVRRTEPDAEKAATALTQVVLRRKAVAKFGADAERMYFTPDGLEQATRRRVADHRAARLAAAQPASVVDLGCGIGGDLTALARAGLVAAGVDTDPVRVAVAEANLAALGLEGAATVADATTLNVSAFGAAMIDPARRDGRGRVFDPEGWVPSWEFTTALLAARPSVAKTAPGIPHDLLPDDVEAEWVSENGEVKEAVLWSPHLAVAKRRATVLRAGESGAGLATMTEEDDPYAGQPRPVRPMGRYLYEPDGAVIRAGLVTAVAAGVEGGLLNEKVAYVVSDEGFRLPFATTYEVLDELPYREKQLRAALRERDIGALTVKKRGVDVVPEELVRRLALSGSKPATVVLTRRQDGAEEKGVALLVRAV